MDEAVRFAREIMRKRRACYETESHTLKHDYQKSISRDMKDLIYYAACHKLNMIDIWKQAVKEA